MKKERSKTSKNTTTHKHRLLFKLITVFIPLLILLVFEGVLRLAGYGDNLSLFIRNPKDGYNNYMIVNPEIGKKYFQKFEYTAPANDIFSIKKPENTFRVFVMGSSTVYGFPYDRNLMFSRILHKQLEDAYPDKNIEVVNTAITAINSFTLLDFASQILDYEPDAVLIYAGHNEFYGAFGTGSNETMSRNRNLTRLHLAMMDSRLYQLLRNTIAGVAQNMAGRKNNEPHGTLMKRMVADKEILYNSKEYQLAIRRYKENISDMLEKFREKKVPVFFSEVVCNLSGMEPFYSIQNDTLEAAAEVFQKARVAEKKNNFDTALKQYKRARDLDVIRFRASEDINRIIDELAGDFNLYLVQMDSVFQQHSPNRLPGNNLFTEHVHPNIDGNFLMAETFLNELRRSKILDKPDQKFRMNTSYYKQNWGYTALDSLIAHHRVQLLKGYWPFVTDAEKEYNYTVLYQPKNYLDSLALSVLKNPQLMLADVRLDLARQYEKAGQFNNAFKEYEALLRTNPYVAVNYRDAADCLLQLADLPLALDYLRKSLKYDESFYARFRIGEIYLLKGDYDNAVQAFEQAFPLAPDDKKVNVLGKTYLAFVYSNKTEQAKAAADELKRVKATKFLRVPPQKYVYDQYIPFQTRKQVLQAKQLISENKNDEALQLLKSSLAHYESHVANRLIGEIYFRQQKGEQALRYFHKVYDQFKFDPRFLNDMALLSLAENDVAGAKKYMEEIRQIDPDYKSLVILNRLLSQTN